jgi:hypothetical protein
MTSKRNLYLCKVAVLSHTISQRGVTLCVIFHNLFVMALVVCYFIFVRNLLLNVGTEFVHIVGLCPPVPLYAFLFAPMRATCFILHILVYFYRPNDIGRY